VSRGRAGCSDQHPLSRIGFRSSRARSATSPFVVNASNSPAGERLTPEVLAGQAVYTRRLLRAYDLIVLGISNRFIWRCPTPRLLRH